MKKKIFNNIGFKILAFLGAIVVWWVIMNIDDPLVKKTLTGIAVELRNAETLTDKGYIYQVNSGNVISITVRAPQSVADSLKASDFIAYADLSQLSPLTDSAAIEIECTKSDVRSDIKEITSKTQVVRLTIDNKQTRDIPVRVEITGLPAADYVIGADSISQNKVQVTGAAGVVETISEAVILYDVSDAASSIDERVTPVFYDENGNIVDVSNLEVNRKTLRLTVAILPTKWVNINITPSGSVAEGYKFIGYTQSISQVKLAGTAENLANINSIDIPSDAVVMDSISESQDYPVIIANYLPGAYSIVSDEKELTVHVDVEPLITKSYTIRRGGIKVNNLADNLEMEFLDPYVVIQISAIQEVHDTFNLDALNTNVDLHGYGPGEYSPIIIMSEDDNFDVVGTYTVRIAITSPEEETEEGTGEEESGISGRER